MKKRLLIGSIFCFFSLPNLSAQDMQIEFSNGSLVHYGLATVDSLSFANSDINLHLSGSGVTSYGLDTVSNFTFVDITTGLNSFKEISFNFELSPNPSNGLLKLHYKMSSTDPIQMKIYSSTGQVFMSRELEGASEESTLNLNDLGMIAGIYFVELSCRNEKLIKKLIKQ
jgi:hypothetical protein